MRYSGNLKLGQLTKLFVICKLSLMPCLDILGIEKVFILNFQLRTSLVIRKITQISLWAGPYTVQPTSNLNWPEAQHKMASAPCRTPCQAWGRSRRLDLSSPDRLRPHCPTCAPPTECHPHAPSHATLSSMGIPVEGESRVCLLIQLHISTLFLLSSRRAMPLTPLRQVVTAASSCVAASPLSVAHPEPSWPLLSADRKPPHTPLLLLWSPLQYRWALLLRVIADALCSRPIAVEKPLGWASNPSYAPNCTPASPSCRSHRPRATSSSGSSESAGSHRCNQHGAAPLSRLVGCQAQVWPVQLNGPFWKLCGLGSLEQCSILIPHGI
jgi:hypothetical protein